MAKLIVCCLTLTVLASFVSISLADPLPSGNDQFRFKRNCKMYRVSSHNCKILNGAAPMDAISDYFDSRARRSEGGGSDRGGLGFTRSLRRTLPFQLVPQPPLAYARSNSYVGEPKAIEVNTNLDSSSAAAVSLAEDNFEPGSVRSRALHHPRMVSHTEEQDARLIYLLRKLFGIPSSDLVQRNYNPSREASASEILSMLEKLTNSREGKRRMRYGLF